MKKLSKGSKGGDLQERQHVDNETGEKFTKICGLKYEKEIDKSIRQKVNVELRTVAVLVMTL